MEIRKHHSCNHSFGAPSDMTTEECSALPVALLNTGQGLWAQSFWKPAPEELAALNAGGSVVLMIRLAGSHPVVSVGATDAVTEAV